MSKKAIEERERERKRELGLLITMDHSLRPFLYVINWPWQFNKIRAHVEEMERA